MKNVAAAIFILDNSVLIARRASKEDLAGYWEFPGGKQEEGESIFECLEREIFEEFNVKCNAKNIYSESIYTYEKGAINLIAIQAELLDSAIELSVHDSYKWVKFDDLIHYNFAPADIPITQKLIIDYGKNI